MSWSALSVRDPLPIRISQPGVSKHLRVLREAGLVEVRTDAQRRLYRLRTEPLREIDEWLAPYRAAWAASMRWKPISTTWTTEETTWIRRIRAAPRLGWRRRRVAALTRAPHRTRHRALVRHRTRR